MNAFCPLLPDEYSPTVVAVVEELYETTLWVNLRSSAMRETLFYIF